MGERHGPGPGDPPARRDAVGPRLPLPGASPEGARDPIRWHAEWSATGLSLWLGVDASVPIASLVPLVLRALAPRCAREGVRLARLVCNGQELWVAEPDSPFSGTPAAASFTAAPSSTESP